MSEVKLVKLLTGEDVIAEIISVSADSVTVRNPVRILVMPDNKAGFVKWAELSSDIEMRINAAHVVAVVNPHKPLTDQYLKMHSKIIPAGGVSSLILPQ